jgi:copper chaperone CopZ
VDLRFFRGDISDRVFLRIYRADSVCIMSEATFAISGMHCGACVKRIEAALAPLAAEVRVTLEPPAARVIDAKVDFSDIAQAVASAGNYSIDRRKAAREAPGNGALAAIPIVVASTATGTAPGLPTPSAEKGWLETYQPLILILAFLVAVVTLAQDSQTFNGETWMRHFMAGFFLVFSFFKLLDVRAFADAYAGYDLIAARWRGWGHLYPFVELAFGIAYLTNFAPRFTNAAVVIVMGISAIGVIRAVMNKQQIRCACLGAVFNLPMSTVTIVEDVAMVAMAGWMLL